MAAPRRSAGLAAALLVAVTLAAVVMVMPAPVSAAPVAGKTGTSGSLGEEEAAVGAGEAHRRLIRNRRNISWYKQHSDFWNWYKYFTDNGNQEAVQELDRIYLSYLQNKNRAEGRRSYKAYLRHLGEIYKSCADSDDPNCVASYTSRPKPEPPKPAPLKTCDPNKDPYCLYAAMLGGKNPYLLPAAPAPVKSPAPLFARSLAPAKDPQAGYHHYYAPPQPASFLSKEQKAELLRICNPEDVECLQYHLRGTYGTPPAGLGHLGCDPKVDPACKPQPVRKAASGIYLQYPACDPLRDPYCAYAASLAAPRTPNPPPAPAGSGSCNPIFEDGCNPLTATKYGTPPVAYPEEQSEEAAAALRPPPPAADHYSDPYGMFRDGNRVGDPYAAYRRPSSPPANDPYAMLRRFVAQNEPFAPRAEAVPDSNDPYAAAGRHGPSPHYPYSPPTHEEPAPESNDPYAAAGRHGASPHYPYSPPTYEEPAQEERHPLGPPGKTKEGYDCFIGYDRECFPSRPSEPRSGAHRRVPYAAEAYEPHLKGDGTRDGVLEPADPHCDPEYDRDCRLRRPEPERPEATPEAAPADDGRGAERDPYEAEPYQSGSEEPRVSNQPPPPQGMPSLQDILRRYGDQFPEHDDYRKK